MALAIGTKLGPYEVLGHAGSGGMGEVYRARDTRLERIVAIKILPSMLAASPAARQRFEREARALSSLSHSHICQLYDIGQQDGVDYLVLEYLEGETLADRLLARGKLAIELVLKVGGEIADALEKAHAKGIIHRDLKPSNIMLTKQGAKLLDFGLAKPCESGIDRMVDTITVSQSLTAEGTIVGTYQYMSPEQIENREADARSDIFAMGAVLYETATGVRAFEGRTQATVIAAVLDKDPPPISSVQPMTPPALDRVVKTCLRKDPDERFQTAHDLKLQLQWILEGLTGSTPEAVPVAPRKVGRFNRERIAWATATLALVCALVVTLFVARRAGSVVSSEEMRFEVTPSKGTQLAPSAGVAVSRDSRQMAFIAQSGGKTMLWVRPLDSLDAKQVPGTEGAEHPFWSPDSRALGFFVGNKLRRVRVGGGDPETVATIEQPMGGTWSNAGVILVGSQHDGIYKVPDTGGAPQKITELDRVRNETSHRWPSMLPDGTHFVFECGVGGVSTANHICTASLKSPTPKVILAASSNVQYASGYLFYFHEGALHAHPFDLDKLATTAPPVHVVERVHFDPDVGDADFAVTNRLIAYEPGMASDEDQSAATASGTDAPGTPNALAVVSDWKAVLASLVPDKD